MSSRRPSPAHARALLFLAAFLFSTGGAAIKGCTLTSWQVAGFRSGIAALAVWVFLPEARRNWTWRTAAIATTYAATLVLFVLATRTTTSANAIFLQSTAPLYLLLLGPLCLKEPIRQVDVAVIGAVGAGAVLLFSGEHPATQTAPAPHLGNMLGAFSGLTWAITLAGLRWMGKKAGNSESPAAVVVVGNVFAFAMCLPFALPIHAIGFQNAMVLLYLGIFQIGLAYMALTRSIRWVPAIEASTLLLLEPVFNPIWTWLIQRERPGNSALLGGMLIIVATFAGACWQNRLQSRAPAT